MKHYRDSHHKLPILWTSKTVASHPGSEKRNKKKNRNEVMGDFRINAISTHCVLA